MRSGENTIRKVDLTKGDNISLYNQCCGSGSQGAVPPAPPSSMRGNAGRNHLNKGIIPLLPTGIGEASAELTRGAPL